MALYNAELHRVVEQVLGMLEEKRYPSITEVPTCWHPGLQGGNPDASSSATESNKGWGTCVMGHLTGVIWDEGARHALTKGIISISPLELLGSAITLELAHFHD